MAEDPGRVVAAQAEDLRLWFGADVVPVRAALRRLHRAVEGEALPSIMDVPGSCRCGWRGTVGEAVPAIDGEGNFGCADCGRVVVFP